MDKTIAIAFLRERKALAYKIWKEEGCTIEEAVHKSWDISLPKYLKLLDEYKKKK